MVRYGRGVLGDVVCFSMLGFTCTSALDKTIDDGLLCSCLYRGARRSYLHRVSINWIPQMT